MKLRLINVMRFATGTAVAAMAVSLATSSTASALQTDSVSDGASGWTTDQIVLVGLLAALLVVLAVAGFRASDKKLRLAIADHCDDPVDLSQGAPVEARNLSRRFGGRWVVSRASFTASAGSLTAIVGPAGAGKSCLLSMTAGADDPTSGDAIIGVTSLHDNPSEFRARVGIVERSPRLYPSLTLGENLRYFTKLFGMDRDASNAAIAYALGLTSIFSDRDTLVSQLGPKQMQRAAIARALLHRPGVLFIDEPHAGYRANEHAQVDQLLCDLQHAGVTVVFTADEFAFDRSIALADQLMTMKNGTIVHHGDPTQLSQAEADRIYSETFELVIDVTTGNVRARDEDGSDGGSLDVGLIDINADISGIDRAHEQWLVQ